MKANLTIDAVLNEDDIACEFICKFNEITVDYML